MDISFCIPAFHDSPFVQWTLDKTAADFPNANIIVSDDTPQRKRPLVFDGAYSQNWTRLGAFPNHRQVLLQANTKYCMYLGDDDYLLPEEVKKGVDFMEAHPEVLVYYAPCQIYDECEQKIQLGWETAYKSVEETFSQRPAPLYEFIMQNHVWPEHAIYRRERLEKILEPRTPPYWCFVDIANAIRQGPIHFTTKPFYRNIAGGTHPCGNRTKLGDELCLVDFGNVQAGLEVMSYRLFQGEHLTAEVKNTLNNMIRRFMWVRIDVASRIYQNRGKIAEATVLRERCELTGY
jgi:hypothetical protein